MVEQQGLLGWVTGVGASSRASLYEVRIALFRPGVYGGPIPALLVFSASRTNFLTLTHATGFHFGGAFVDSMF